MRAIPSRAAYHPHTKTTASLPGLPAYRTPCTHPSAATNIASLYQNRCSSQQRPPQGTARGDAPTSTLAAGLSTCSDFKIVAPSLVTVTLCPRPVDCRILSCKTKRPQPIISSIPGGFHRHHHHYPPPIQTPRPLQPSQEPLLPTTRYVISTLEPPAKINNNPINIRCGAWHVGQAFPTHDSRATLPTPPTSHETHADIKGKRSYHSFGTQRALHQVRYRHGTNEGGLRMQTK
jgi:hypothetical protein